jgi:hypothetical protein
MLQTHPCCQPVLSSSTLFLYKSICERPAYNYSISLKVDASKKVQVPLTPSIHAIQNFSGGSDDMHITF